MRSDGKIKQRVIDRFIAPKCKDVITILYQDDDILLINKPSGLLTLSGKNPLNWDSVHYRLVHGQSESSPSGSGPSVSRPSISRPSVSRPSISSPTFSSAKLPHRLDFGTSGIMVVGLNAVAARQLNKQFQTRTIRKSYMAVLDGWVAEDYGRISEAIAKDSDHFPLVTVCSTTGKPAITDYEVIRRLERPRRSVVKFTPLTGRTHQLRIHSQVIGHPILGCDLYKNDHSERLADRLMLHASDMVFEHPASGEHVHGYSPCPF